MGKCVRGMTHYSSQKFPLVENDGTILQEEEKGHINMIVQNFLRQASDAK